MKSQSNRKRLYEPTRMNKAMQSASKSNSQELDLEKILFDVRRSGYVAGGGESGGFDLLEVSEAKAKLLELALSCLIEMPDMKMWKDIKNRKKFHRYAQDKAVTAAIDTMEQQIKERFS